MNLDLDKVFKFKLGDTLHHAVPSKMGTRLFVCERLLQECPGGVQLTYRCRAIRSFGELADGYVSFIEQELVLAEHPAEVKEDA